MMETTLHKKSSGIYVVNADTAVCQLNALSQVYTVARIFVGALNRHPSITRPYFVNQGIAFVIVPSLPKLRHRHNR